MGKNVPQKWENIYAHTYCANYFVVYILLISLQGSAEKTKLFHLLNFIYCKKCFVGLIE